MKWSVVHLEGQLLLITECCRNDISGFSVPSGLHLSFIRHMSTDLDLPIAIEPLVAFNLWGAVLSKEPLPFIDGIIELNEDDADRIFDARDDEDNNHDPETYLFNHEPQLVCCMCGIRPNDHLSTSSGNGKADPDAIHVVIYSEGGIPQEVIVTDSEETANNATSKWLSQNGFSNFVEYRESTDTDIDISSFETKVIRKKPLPEEVHKQEETQSTTSDGNEASIEEIHTLRQKGDWERAAEIIIKSNPADFFEEYNKWLADEGYTGSEQMDMFSGMVISFLNYQELRG